MLILDKISFYGERQLKNFESTKKLAINGDVDAQYDLGLMYMEAIGTDKNYFKAFEWFYKAAQNGDIQAQRNLAIMYANGLGTEKNNS